MINYGYIGTPAGFIHKAKGSKSPVSENISSWAEVLDLDSMLVHTLQNQHIFILKKFQDNTGKLFFAFMLYRHVSRVLGGNVRNGDFYGSFVFLYENQMAEAHYIVAALESLIKNIEKDVNI